MIYTSHEDIARGIKDGFLRKPTSREIIYRLEHANRILNYFGLSWQLYQQNAHLASLSLSMIIHFARYRVQAEVLGYWARTDLEWETDCNFSQAACMGLDISAAKRQVDSVESSFKLMVESWFAGVNLKQSIFKAIHPIPGGAKNVQDHYLNNCAQLQYSYVPRNSQSVF